MDDIEAPAASTRDFALIDAAGTNATLNMEESGLRSLSFVSTIYSE
jgi:hypothetical protein